MSRLVKSIQSIVSPFEILYLAIAIATFEHTLWAAAFMFEGKVNVDLPGDWYLRGALIAIAVDVGMLISSRMLAGASNRSQKLTLSLSFGIAAVISFYTQLVYMAMHTPDVVALSTLSPFWQHVVQPLLDARILILPLALPSLATIYTLTRLTHHQGHHVGPRHTQTEKVDDPSQTSIRRDLGTSTELIGLLPANTGEIADAIAQGQRVVTTVDNWVIDTDQLVFANLVGKAYGPYKTCRSMAGAFRQATKPKELRAPISN